MQNSKLRWEKKRNRSMNWSESDRILLRKLILKQADVIENKDSTAESNLKKKLAWMAILSSFNTLTTHKRDVVQLQTQWRNMKNKNKTSRIEARHARNATVDDSPPSTPPTEDQEIMVTNLLEIKLETNNVDSHESNQQQDDSEKAKSYVSCPAPETYTSYASSNRETSRSKRKRQDDKNCSCDHEHELFMLAMKAREEAMQRERELHSLKMIEQEEKMKRESEMHEFRIKYEREMHECKMKYESELHEKVMLCKSLEEEYWRKKR